MLAMKKFYTLAELRSILGEPELRATQGRVLRVVEENQERVRVELSEPGSGDEVMIWRCGGASRPENACTATLRANERWEMQNICISHREAFEG